MKFFILVIVFISTTLSALSQNDTKLYFGFQSKTNYNLSIFQKKILKNNYLLAKSKTTSFEQPINLHLSSLSNHYIALYDYSRNNYTFYFSPLYSINFDNLNVKPYNPYHSYTSIDSFNPYGASNVEEALILGLFNYLLKL